MQFFAQFWFQNTNDCTAKRSTFCPVSPHQCVIFLLLSTNTNQAVEKRCHAAMLRHAKRGLRLKVKEIRRVGRDFRTTDPVEKVSSAALEFSQPSDVVTHS